MLRMLPALTESRRARRVAFTALYLAQGIGVGPLLYAVAPYFAEQGLTPAVIGSFVGIVFLPWSLKLVAGPIMDRWTFLPMGRRRPWILAAQAGMILSFTAIALIPEPLAQLGWVTAAAATANAFLAFQDVAIDGMAVDVLPLEEQVQGNALMFGSQSIGIAAATAAAAWLFSTAGLGATFGVSAVTFCGFSLVPLLLRERPGERLLPWSAGAASAAAMAQRLDGWSHIGKSLFRALVMPASLIALPAILTYRTGFGMIVALMPVLAVQQLGWTDTDFSQLKATSDLLGAIACMALGGWLARRFGKMAVIRVAGIGTAILLVVMGLASAAWSSTIVVAGFVGLFSAVNILFSIFFGAVMMSICWKRVAATQFGIYMAIANVGLSAGAALLGPLTARLSSSQILYVMAATYAAMVVAMQMMNPQQHLMGLDALEKREGNGVGLPAAAVDISPI